MNKYRAQDQARLEYGNLQLTYKVTETQANAHKNSVSYGKLQSALAEVGVSLKVANGQLTLRLEPDTYMSVKKRWAGRKEVIATKKESSPGEDSFYRYSDILFLESMYKDAEVIAMTGMKPATYYRHKKALRQSAYYAALDLTRTGDKNYLESIEGNFLF